MPPHEQESGNGSNFSLCYLIFFLWSSFASLLLLFGFWKEREGRGKKAHWLTWPSTHSFISSNRFILVRVMLNPGFTGRRLLRGRGTSWMWHHGAACIHTHTVTRMFQETRWPTGNTSVRVCNFGFLLRHITNPVLYFYFLCQKI